MHTRVLHGRERSRGGPTVGARQPVTLGIRPPLGRILEVGAGPLGPLSPLGYGPLLFGFLLPDVLLLRSGGVPRGVPVLLIAGAVANAAGFATPEVRLAGVVLFGAGIAWLGLAALAASLRTAGPAPGGSVPRPGRPAPAGTATPA